MKALKHLRIYGKRLVEIFGDGEEIFRSCWSIFGLSFSTDLITVDWNFTYKPCGCCYYLKVPNIKPTSVDWRSRFLIFNFFVCLQIMAVILNRSQLLFNTARMCLAAVHMELSLPNIAAGCKLIYHGAHLLVNLKQNGNSVSQCYVICNHRSVEATILLDEMYFISYLPLLMAFDFMCKMVMNLWYTSCKWQIQEYFSMWIIFQRVLCEILLEFFIVLHKYSISKLKAQVKKVFL